jgi:hypothetical protein
MVHIDVKKVGRIPDGGGWRAHGRNSDHSRAAARNKKRTGRGGVGVPHSAIDGHTRLASTAIAFLHRARAWFAAHGITRIERLITDSDACNRADAFTRALLGSRCQRTRSHTALGGQPPAATLEQTIANAMASYTWFTCHRRVLASHRRGNQWHGRRVVGAQ